MWWCFSVVQENLFCWLIKMCTHTHFLSHISKHCLGLTDGTWSKGICTIRLACMNKAIIQRQLEVIGLLIERPPSVFCKTAVVCSISGNVWDRPPKEAGLDWIRQRFGSSHGGAEEKREGGQVQRHQVKERARTEQLRSDEKRMFT